MKKMGISLDRPGKIRENKGYRMQLPPFGEEYGKDASCMAYLIGIDLGTSGTKTVLFDQEGHVVASATVEYPMYQEHNGWAEQDPLDWWNATCQTIKAVIEKSGVSNQEVKAVGISGQMHGLVMLDKEGNLLRRSIIWCDQRTAAECEEITQRVGQQRLIEITANPALTGFTASKILWCAQPPARALRQVRPHSAAQGLCALHAHRRVRHRGLRRLRHAAAGPCPAAAGARKSWRSWTSTPPSWPRCTSPPKSPAEITSRAAELTGLKAGTPRGGRRRRQRCRCRGHRRGRDGKAFTTIGTSGVVFAHTDNISIDPKGRVHTFCCAVPGAWHVMGVTQGAGLSLKWFRDNFCGAEKETALGMGKDPYFLMDQEAERSPIVATACCTCPTSWASAPPIWTPTAAACSLASPPCTPSGICSGL